LRKSSAPRKTPRSSAFDLVPRPPSREDVQLGEPAYQDT
jgi:hypothetical protein